MEGYTLALDFPMRPGLLNFLNTLDALVLQAGGRIYLAKDARMSAEMFHASYAQNATDFISQLHNVSANSFLASALSERLRIV
jgi:hypothetical protein